jgi:hypothetical protein
MQDAKEERGREDGRRARDAGRGGLCLLHLSSRRGTSQLARFAALPSDDDG